MKKTALLTLVLGGFLTLCSPSLPAFEVDENFTVESMRTVQGNILSIDTANNRITARWLQDELRMKWTDVVMDVPDNCVITKNGEAINLNDVEANDPATIRFDSNADPLPRAKSITITE